MAQEIATAIARKNLAHIVRRSAAGTRIKLTRYGKIQAVLIPEDDFRFLEHCERNASPAGARNAAASADHEAGGARFARCQY